MIKDKLNEVDRKTAWAFNPWLPPVLATLAVFVVALAFDSGEPARRASILAASGAIVVCFGLLSIARPVIRVGGWVAYHDKSVTTDGGSFDPSPAESRAIEEARKDTLSVQVIGPAMAIGGTLTNGFSGLLV